MPRPDSRAITLLLGLLCGISPFSSGVYMPSMPDIARSLAASPAEVQLTISAYLFGLGLGQLVHGPTSDRLGRRPVLLVALSVFTLTTLVCMVAWNVHVLLLARAFQAFSGAAGITISRAIVRDVHGGRRAAQQLSLVGTFMALGPIAGPLVGGVFQAEWGWRSIFFGVFVASSLLLLAVIFFLGETLKQRAPEPLSIPGTLRTFGGLLRVPAYLVYTAIGAASFAGGYAWLSGSSFVLQELYRFSPVEFAGVYAVNSAGYLVGTAVASQIVMRRGINFTMGVGGVIEVLAGAALILIVAFGVSSKIAMIIPPTLFLLGMGLVLPQSMAGALALFPRTAGAAASLTGALQQGAGAVGAAAVGLFLGASAWPVAIAVAVLGFVTFALWVGSRDLRLGAAAANA